ncbi:hypothetical protein BW687_006715 [Pseudomonas graminis]|uniref:hypothetical protein n=1 Tax=Pseudomonas graminis TaxID=158627 RepID=UPI00234A0FA7|nr:hypothetical protein [Pseudomonas graminis]MDC6379872.1 hypothetical protein [Pseudomonas graminis]
MAEALIAQMLEGERQLQHMLVSRDAHTAITQILVATPAWMYNKGRWHMESVNKVAVGHDQPGGKVSLIEIECGAVNYTSHSPDVHSDLLTNPCPIFLSSIIRPV